MKMDEKTKSILIGLACGGAAVLVIVLLFFAISGLTGGNKRNRVKDDNAKDNYSQDIVESNGNTIVLFDDTDDDDDDEDDEDVSSVNVSSKDNTSSEEPVKKATFFGRSDIESIIESADKFSEFVNAVAPVSYEWTTAGREAVSEVKVKLIASDGSFAVIGVPYESKDYTVDGSKNGSGENVKNWSLFKISHAESCSLIEIVMFSNKMKFNLPRGVKIGTAYNSVSEAYLKIENPDKSYLLYEGTDVLKDSGKLSAYKKNKSAYIGGKIYKISTYLNSFYSDNNDAYPFAGKCNNIIRYGFNSIYDTSVATGQWNIEYATKDNKVVGVRFYYDGVID